MGLEIASPRARDIQAPTKPDLKPRVLLKHCGKASVWLSAVEVFGDIAAKGTFAENAGAEVRRKFALLHSRV